MATVVTRRILPPRHRRLATREPHMRLDNSFFLGLAVAIPLGLLCWLGLVLAFRAIV